MTLDTIREQADYLVYGTLIQLDDARQNAIMHVEESLIGSDAPEYLLLYRESPLLWSVFVERGYDVGCSLVGANLLSPGLTGYWAVARQPDGAYRVVDMYNEPFFSPMWEREFGRTDMPSINVRIDPQSEDVRENINAVEFENEAAFRTFIEAETGEPPTPPQQNEIPILRPLLVRMQDDTQLMIPVDGGEPARIDEPIQIENWSAYDYPDFLQSPLLCAQVDCQLTSPNGIFYATQNTPNEIQLNTHFAMGGIQMLTGQAFQFSPNSEALVIWNEGVAQVYVVQDALCDCIMYGGPQPDVTIALEIPMADQDLFADIRWSMDGTTIAYSDADGLWVMDIFRQSEPELVIASDEPIHALSLFTSGRFIAFTHDNITWSVLDRLTGEQYPNTLLSRDERYFVVVDDEDTSIEDRAYPLCTAPISTTCFATFSPDTLRQVIWTERSRGIAAVCDTEVCTIDSVPILLSADQIRARVRVPAFPSDSTIADMIYDSRFGVFAGAFVHESTSEVHLYRAGVYIYPPITQLSRSITLDGVIRDMMWMDSLFYVRIE